MKSPESVAQELRCFIEDNFLFGVPIQLGDEDSFMKKGIIDSTGVLELVSYVEQIYGIKLSDTELIPDNLDSVAALTRFVTGKLDAQRRAASGSY